MKVKLFASCRELIKSDTLDIEYKPGETVAEFRQRAVGDVLGKPDWVKSVVVAVNSQVPEPDATFAETDEVALIPPVSGGLDAGRATLTDAPIDVNAALAAVQRPEHGAVVLFLGVVRNQHDGKNVSHLEYEAYPAMAQAKLQEILDETQGTWSDVLVAMVHRTGELKVGDISLAIAAGSPHRPQAFEACRHALERVKVAVPIWKKEFSPDGVSWVEGAVLEP